MLCNRKMTTKNLNPAVPAARPQTTIRAAETCLHATGCGRGRSHSGCLISTLLDFQAKPCWNLQNSLSFHSSDSERATLVSAAECSRPRDAANVNHL